MTCTIAWRGSWARRRREIQQAVRQADGDLGENAAAAGEGSAMKVSPFAGKPAEPAMLVNVPGLVTYYS